MSLLKRKITKNSTSNINLIEANAFLDEIKKELEKKKCDSVEDIRFDNIVVGLSLAHASESADYLRHLENKADVFNVIEGKSSINTAKGYESLGMICVAEKLNDHVIKKYG